MSIAHFLGQLIGVLFAIAVVVGLVKWIVKLVRGGKRPES